MDTIGFGDGVNGADHDGGLDGCHDGCGDNGDGGDTRDEECTAGSDAGAETKEADEELHGAGDECNYVNDLSPFGDDSEGV